MCIVTFNAFIDTSQHVTSGHRTEKKMENTEHINNQQPIEAYAKCEREWSAINRWKKENNIRNG